MAAYGDSLPSLSHLDLCGHVRSIRDRLGVNSGPIRGRFWVGVDLGLIWGQSEVDAGSTRGSTRGSIRDRTGVDSGSICDRSVNRLAEHLAPCSPCTEIISSDSGLLPLRHVAESRRRSLHPTRLHTWRRATARATVKGSGGRVLAGSSGAMAAGLQPPDLRGWPRRGMPWRRPSFRPEPKWLRTASLAGATSWQRRRRHDPMLSSVIVPLWVGPKG